MKQSLTRKIYEKEGLKACINYIINKRIYKIKDKFYCLLSPIIWRLPLPKTYHFLLIANYACGSMAIQSFLSKCGVSLNSNFGKLGDFTRNRKIYYTKYFFHALSPNSYKALNFRPTHYLDTINTQKLLARIHKNIPLLVPVRDPFSLFLTAFNHTNSDKAYNIKVHFKLFDDFKTFFNQKTFRALTLGDLQVKTVALKHPKIYLTHFFIIMAHFKLYSITKLFTGRRANKVYYIDLQELSQQKAFKTMQTLSHSFGFPQPKEEDKAFYEEKAYNALSFLFLPLIITIPISSHNIEITITTYQQTIHFQSQKSINEFFSIPQNLNIHLLIYPKDLKILKSNLEVFSQVINYINNILLEMQEATLRHNQAKLKEKDILEIVATNPLLKRELKEFLDYELQDIKKCRRDIVDSWEHYRAFEAMF
ncbi:DUF2972 domain-containing protein [Helicobacter apodemus]|uniref:DUF2972 domain-containing protein n=1 Tax=Helicobacter apodemus TaxID=135569 RepID=A0A4U8UFK4_9HELI|nr:DUF2972 domain-containing protein [Helicobacter apodemus]TLE16646.1 DUF2972 domain-containing protein [Helicobacter apodemus]